MAVFGPIILLGALAVLALATSTLARWMLKPLFAAQQMPRPKTQYFLSDMYVMLLQLALPGMALTFEPQQGALQALPLVATLWVLLILLWLIGVQLLSRAGVTKTWPRALSLGLAIPGAYLGSFSVSVLTLSSVLGPSHFLLVSALGVVALFAVCNGIARWAVHQSQH